jgi:hypothetical protein
MNYNKKFDNAISVLEKKYSNNMSKNNISYLKICNKKNYNNFTRKIVSSSYTNNHNQFIYNLIYSCVKKRIKILLGTNCSSYMNKNKKKETYYGNDISYILKLYDSPIINDYKEYYYKFIYIFFLYLPMNRNIIDRLQWYFKNVEHNLNKYNTNYGVLNEHFFQKNIKNTVPIVTHSFIDDRFRKQNAIININNNIDIYIKQKEDILKISFIEIIEEIIFNLFRKAKSIKNFYEIYKNINIENIYTNDILKDNNIHDIENILKKIIDYFHNDFYDNIYKTFTDDKNSVKKYLNESTFNTYKKYLNQLIENKYMMFEMRYMDRINYNLEKKENYKNYNNNINCVELIKIYFNVDNNIIPKSVYNNDNINIYLNIQPNYNIGYGRNIYCSQFSGMLGNYLGYLEDRLQFINILLYCLKTLENSIDIDLKKNLIIVFYYIIILLMPLKNGTASIAEVCLYSLWEKYIPGFTIKINPNIMLDVEALSLPFNTFLYNCFNKETIIESHVSNVISYFLKISVKKNINKKEMLDYRMNQLSFFTPYLIIMPLVKP